MLWRQWDWLLRAGGIKGDYGVLTMMKQILISALCAFFMSTAFAAGTLEEELEKNKEALKEFKTLSPYEQCIYLKLDDCDDL